METRQVSRALLALFLLFGLLAGTPAPSSASHGEQVAPAPRDFIRIQYEDFLARQPDAAGLDFWARRIDNGEDRGNLIDSMVSAPEFAETVAPLSRLYQAYFLRTPDFDGLNFWVGQKRAGNSLTRISDTFAASPEFEARYGQLSNAEFVDLVYTNVLGRPADSGGLNFWVAELNAGASRGSVMLGFSESPEYVKATFGQVRAAMLYLGMLRRTPEPGGLTYWASQIDAGVSYGSVVRGFLNSPEYQARLAALLPHTHPLTGEASATAVTRPALALKIDDTQAGRPQVGPNQADIVYEEMVEGNLTRLITIFHSQAPEAVGPVRSVRTSDFDVLSAFNTPLLGASGANPTVLSLLNNYPIINVNANNVGNAYSRVGGRSAPYNLFANPYLLWNAAPASAGTPPSVLVYRDHDDPLVPSATATGGVDIAYGRADISFRWSATRGGWLRTLNGSPHVDADGIQIAPENLIVMVNNYVTSVADVISPEAVTVGVGEAWVFTAGKRLTCYWSRTSNTAPITYTDPDGRPCALTPGQTWVSLAPPRTVTLR